MPDSDTPDCSACNALGEDPRTGATCWTCRGRGYLPASPAGQSPPDDDAPEADVGDAWWAR